MTNWQSGQLNGCLTNKLLITIYQLLLVPTLAIYQVYHLLYEKLINWSTDQLINIFYKVTDGLFKWWTYYASN